MVVSSATRRRRAAAAAGVSGAATARRALDSSGRGRRRRRRRSSRRRSLSAPWRGPSRASEPRRALAQAGPLSSTTRTPALPTHLGGVLLVPALVQRHLGGGPEQAGVAERGRGRALRCAAGRARTLQHTRPPAPSCTDTLRAARRASLGGGGGRPAPPSRSRHAPSTAHLQARAVRLELLHCAGAEGVAGRDHDLDAVLDEPVGHLLCVAGGAARELGVEPACGAGRRRHGADAAAQPMARCGCWPGHAHGSPPRPRPPTFARLVDLPTPLTPTKVMM